MRRHAAWYNSTNVPQKIYTSVRAKNEGSRLSSFFFSLKSLRSQRMVCRGNDHILILHHSEWHFALLTANREIIILNYNPLPAVHAE